MTEREAQELVRAIEHLWSWDMGPEGRATWTEALKPMNGLHASEAVLRLSQRQRERPRVADVRNMLAKVVRDHSEPKRHELPRAGDSAPLWVKRWVCARYLYARFGQRQDMRRFREQGEWVDPLIPLMPDEEWEEQALTITDWDVLAAIGSVR